ncbi:MAG TPA: neutral zinc metallopeptidase [Burkholderiales bacterium]|nr:neutral zinc metallopeptidase [Burkholderiales bacterium]
MYPSCSRDPLTRFHAPRDFAKAYAIAREAGHRAQNLLHLSERVRAARQRASEPDANALPVRVELQADRLARAWADRAYPVRHIFGSGSGSACSLGRP